MLESAGCGSIGRRSEKRHHFRSSCFCLELSAAVNQAARPSNYAAWRARDLALCSVLALGKPKAMFLSASASSISCLWKKETPSICRVLWKSRRVSLCCRSRHCWSTLRSGQKSSKAVCHQARVVRTLAHAASMTSVQDGLSRAQLILNHSGPRRSTRNLPCVECDECECFLLAEGCAGDLQNRGSVVSVVAQVLRARRVDWVEARKLGEGTYGSVCSAVPRTQTTGHVPKMPQLPFNRSKMISKGGSGHPCFLRSVMLPAVCP